MPGIREAALMYVAVAKKNPAAAGDASLLDKLECAALSDMSDGFVTLTAPASDKTWEIRALLPGIANDTGRQTFKFPWAVDVVGFLPTVVPIRPIGGGLLAPTTDDLDMMLDINNEENLSSAQGISTPSGVGGNTFCTLSAFSSLIANRVQAIRLAGTTPTLGFTFRWKQVPPAAGPIWADCVIGCAIFAYKWKYDPSWNGADQQRR